MKTTVGAEGGLSPSKTAKTVSPPLAGDAREPREACLLEERGHDEPGPRGGPHHWPRTKYPRPPSARAALARIGRGAAVGAAAHAREGRGLAEAAHRGHVGDRNADAARGREQAARPLEPRPSRSSPTRSGPGARTRGRARRASSRAPPRRSRCRTAGHRRCARVRIPDRPAPTSRDARSIAAVPFISLWLPPADVDIIAPGGWGRDPAFENFPALMGQNAVRACVPGMSLAAPIQPETTVP